MLFVEYRPVSMDDKFYMYQSMHVCTYTHNQRVYIFVYTQVQLYGVCVCVFVHVLHLWLMDSTQNEKNTVAKELSKNPLIFTTLALNLNYSYTIVVVTMATLLL